MNQYNVLHNNIPFGGKKQSGFGTSIIKQIVFASVLVLT